MTDIEQEARAAAVRETARYLDLIHRRGLVSLADVLADLEAVAQRMEQGMNARGNLRASRPASPADLVKLRAERDLHEAVALRQVQYRKTQVARLTSERDEALATIEQVRAVMFNDERSSVVLATIRAIVNRQELTHDR